MNKLDPKAKELIKEHREAEAWVVKLRKKRKACLLKLKQQGFTHKQLSIHFRISEKRIRQIIREGQG